MINKNIMSMKLLNNSIDSFNESLKKYEEAVNGDKTAYKFVILNFVHFSELLFKSYLYEIHPLLVFKNPFSKKINKHSSTIGLWEAINFLENDNIIINQSFKSDLKYIKEIRNQIEHYEFQLDIDKLNEVLGKLMNAIMEFDNLDHGFKIFTEENIKEYILKKNFNIFKKLATEYKDKFDLAKKRSEEAIRVYVSEYQDGGDTKIYDCPYCGNNNFLIPNSDSQTGYKCCYCGNEESDYIEVECVICGCEWTKDRMIYWDDLGYICPSHEMNPEHRHHND